jgi:hypothetical protein
MKKTPKPTDVNVLASQIVAEATEDETNAVKTKKRGLNDLAFR